jgi:HEAT repeat protein
VLYKVNTGFISPLLSHSRKSFNRLFTPPLGDIRILSALMLYKLLKKAEKFVRTDEADAALKELKMILSLAPILAAPESMEPMLIYMAATNRVISIVVVVER